MNSNPAPQRSPQSWDDKAILALFIVVMAGLMLYGVFKDYQPAKLSIIFFVLFYLATQIVHQAGHVLMAAALGWKVEQITIGFGRAWAEFRWGSLRVELRTIPLSDFVQSRPGNQRQWSRGKSALIYLAGPGIELLLLVPIIAWLGWQGMFAASDHPAVIAAQTLALVIVLTAGINLVPHAIPTRHGSIASDGMGIFLSLFAPKPRVQ